MRRKTILPRTKAAVLARAGNCCEECERPDGYYKTTGGKRAVLELHHRLPISEGGDDSEANLMILCHFCHVARHPIRGPKKKTDHEQRIRALESPRVPTPESKDE